MKPNSFPSLINGLILATANANTASAGARITLPVETVDGRDLELRSVGASRGDDGVTISGWVGLRLATSFFHRRTYTSKQ